MKRILTTLAIVLSTVQIFASELIIKGKIDMPFSVVINNEKYYSYNNQIHISNLYKGTYFMEIYVEGYVCELLYNCSIDIPKNAIVTATFTGDNRIYVSSAKTNHSTSIYVTPYPHRNVVHNKVYQSTPKKSTPSHMAPVHSHSSQPKDIDHTTGKPKQATSSSSSQTKPATSNTTSGKEVKKSTPRNSAATRK